jgi:S-DNA-T family DNA segregation ATPase FtsK/SpoIIIE
MPKHTTHPGSDLTLTVAEPSSSDAGAKRKVSISLQIVEGRPAGKTFDLSRGGEFTIGREGCDINLEDPRVSRQHARISIAAWDHIYLQDLKSKNGSFVNGSRQTRRKIGHNDLVRIGSTSLRLTILETPTGGKERTQHHLPI